MKRERGMRGTTRMWRVDGDDGDDGDDDDEEGAGVGTATRR